MTNVAPEAIRLELKDQFREPLDPNIGFFGRRAEVSRLSAIMNKRSAATVLISGHRGVGKSSLVEHAIDIAKSGPNAASLLVARLTLSDLKAEEEMPRLRSSIRDEVLRSLARSLYFAIEHGDKIRKTFKDKSSALYEKTCLRELEEHTALESIAESHSERRLHTTTESIHSPSETLSTALGGILGGAVGVGGVSVVSQAASIHGTTWSVIATLLIAGASVASGYTLKRMRATETAELSKATKIDKRSRTGTWDLSSETLEFELRTLLTEMQESNLRCVFVIDELDKIVLGVEGGDDIESHPIFHVVSSLKNFFTLGSGIFIFISGDDFYRQLERSLVDSDYPLAHTLFTDRLFVHSLHYADLEDLVDNLLAKSRPTDAIYRQFRNYLCWEAKNHVFDLLGLINDFVIFEDGRPVLLAEPAGVRDGRWREGNLPDNWRNAAALQKTIGAIYDEHARPGARAEAYNQTLWRLLRHFADSLYIGKRLDLEEGQVDLPSDEPWMEALTATDREDLRGAVERLFARLERFGMLLGDERTEKASAAQPGQTTDTPERSFTRYSLVQPTPYPSGLVSVESEHTPFEETFLDLAGKVATVDSNLKSAHIPLETFQDQIDGIHKLAVSVADLSPRSTVPRSHVSNGYRQAENLLPKLVGHGIELLFTRWADERGYEVSDDLTGIEPRTGVPWLKSLDEFSDLTQALERRDVEYWIAGGATENQLLMLILPTQEQSEDLARRYSETLKGEKGRGRRRQRLPIVTIQIPRPGESIDVPEEIVQIFEPASAGFPILGSLLGFAVRQDRKRKKSVAGWNLFELAPTLDNIQDLPLKLEEVSYVQLNDQE